MSRRSHVPALVLHKPSGQARVRIAGRDFYCGRHGTTEADEHYRRIIADWLATGTPPGGRSAKPAAAPLTVNALILAYWRHARQYYRKQGRETSQVCLVRGVLRLLREHHGSLLVAEFGPQRLKGLQAVLVAQGLTRTGVNRRIDALRRMVRWAVAEELVPVEVAARLATLPGLKQGRSPAPDRPPVRPVSTEDLEATLPQLGLVVADMVRLQLLSGARPGELCDLRPADLVTSGTVWEYRPGRHKLEHHGKARLIGFGARAQEILAPYLVNRPAGMCCFRPCEAGLSGATGSPQQAAKTQPETNAPQSEPSTKRRRPPGERYTAASYRRAIHRACDRAEVPRWSPNRLRHARATELRRLFGVEAARVVLGHAKLSTTELYAERDLEEVRRIMGEVG